MIVKALFKKALPARTGQGKNGAYDFRPFIIEFEEETEKAPIVHTMVVELSASKVNTKALEAVVGTNKAVELYIGFDVREHDSSYFNSIIVYVRDAEYRVERSY